MGNVCMYSDTVHKCKVSIVFQLNCKSDDDVKFI